MSFTQPLHRQRPRKMPRGGRWSLAALLAVQTLLLLLISWRTGPGWDEWGHLPSGLFHWQYGDFQPYCVNPPLIRMIASLPVLLAGGDVEYEPLPEIQGLRVEGFLALNYIQTYGPQTFTWISIARSVLIPISLLGTYLIAVVGTRLYGFRSGLAAATLWCFSPTVLTFGASIAPDVSAAVFGLLAAWRFYIWLPLPSTSSSLFAGACLAVAMLSKATWVILPPLLIVVGLIYARRAGRRWRWHPRMVQVGLITISSWVLVHACYDFRGTLRELGSFEFVSDTLTGREATEASAPATGNRFRGTPLAYLRAPLPADYVRGLDIQKHDFEGANTSYLFGVRRDRGWWYYYLVGILLKEPIAIWIVMATAWGGAAWGSTLRQRRTKRTCQFVIIAPGIAVLILVSSQTGFNHHLRYVLPFLPCMYLLAARPVAKLRPNVRSVCVAALSWYAISGISAVPRTYAFFTEAIGGVDEGWRYLDNSNLDWGQDLLTIKEWVERNPEKRPVYLVYSVSMLDFKKLGIDAMAGDQWVTPNGPTRPGWWVVCAQPMAFPNNRWFREHPPAIQLSVTTGIYQIEKGSGGAN